MKKVTSLLFFALFTLNMCLAQQAGKPAVIKVTKRYTTEVHLIPIHMIEDIVQNGTGSKLTISGSLIGGKTFQASEHIDTIYSRLNAGCVTSTVTNNYNTYDTTYFTEYKYIPADSILNMGESSNPITVVAAQGANYTVVPFNIMMNVEFNTTQYATNTRIEIGYISPATIELWNSDLLDMTVDGFCHFGRTTTFSTNTNQFLANQPLKAWVSGGNPTAGDSPVHLYIMYAKIYTR